MDSGSKKVAIVPALNEEGAIADLVEELRSEAPGYDVLVVDDGSTDATASLAREAGAIVLSHAFNLGIGGAVQSGYRYAFLHGYEVAVQVDGDGQHDPAQLPELEKALHGGEAEMVWGSRFLAGAGYPVGSLRRIGQKMFAKLVSLITRYPVTDPTSGFRMTNRRGIELFARDYPHDFPEVEAILMVHAHDMSMREVPVTMRPRTHGSSSLAGYSAPYYMMRVMLAIFVGLFRRRPIPPPGDDWLAVAPSEALEVSGR